MFPPFWPTLYKIMKIILNPDFLGASKHLQITDRLTIYLQNCLEEIYNIHDALISTWNWYGSIYKTRLLFGEILLNVYSHVVRWPRLRSNIKPTSKYYFIQWILTSFGSANHTTILIFDIVEFGFAGRYHCILYLVRTLGSVWTHGRWHLRFVQRTPVESVSVSIHAQSIINAFIARAILAQGFYASSYWYRGPRDKPETVVVSYKFYNSYTCKMVSF